MAVDEAREARGEESGDLIKPAGRVVREARRGPARNRGQPVVGVIGVGFGAVRREVSPRVMRDRRAGRGQILVQLIDAVDVGVVRAMGEVEGRVRARLPAIQSLSGGSVLGKPPLDTSITEPKSSEFDFNRAQSKSHQAQRNRFPRRS